MSVIKINDRDELVEISFQDVKKYHGNKALIAVAVGFRMLQVALKELASDYVLDRSELHIASGHGGPGFRDVFEYVTRAVTRGQYEVNVSYPVAQYDPHRAQSYAFIISTSEENSIEVSLKEDFLPSEFYDLLKKGRENNLTKEEEKNGRQLILYLSERALTLPVDELLQWRRL